MRVVCFYTNPYYAHCYEKYLRPGLTKFEILHNVYWLEEKESHNENARQKVKFLCDRRAEFEGDLLYLDVDSVVHKTPDINLLGKDLAIPHWERGYQAGTIYMKDTDLVRKFLHSWRTLLDASPPNWTDEQILNKLLSNKMSEEHVLKLPKTYCWIDPIMWEKESEATPVIEHICVGSFRIGVGHVNF